MPTIQTQHRLRGPLQSKKPKAIRTHPGQARRSARKRELQRLRKKPTQAQLAEGMAYLDRRQRPTQATLTDGAYPPPNPRERDLSWAVDSMLQKVRNRPR